MNKSNIKYKILFVDDEENILKAYQRSLKGNFYIDTTMIVREGIEAIKKNQYAVVVADYQMPETNGVQFLNKVKELSPETIRIILTGKADLKTAIKAVNIGQVFRFLTKPCTKEDLSTALRAAFGEYELSILQKKKEIENEYLALHDSLTGLPNRVFLIDRLRQAIALAKRTHTFIAVLFMDLDGFKQINDTEGHDVGDLVLIEVARILKGSVREIDTVSRHGGDEFVIILQNINKTADIEMLLERIINSFTYPLKINNKILQLGVSVGIGLFPVNGDDPEVLIKKADEAMYVAKRNGGMRFYFSEVKPE